MDTAVPDLPDLLAQAYAHGPGKDPRPGPPRPRPAARLVAGADLAALAGSGRYARAVVRTLLLALGPRRWEPWNRYNDHRAYPSPRAAYLVDVALRAGVDRWPVDPVRARLTGADQPAAAAALAGSTPVRLELTVHPERMPASYGPLATALAWLEAGHLAGAVAETATALGLRLSVSAGPGPEPGRPAGFALEVALAGGGAGSGAVERITAARSSGLGPRGLCPDPRPLPAADLHALAAAAADPPPGSPARWPGLRHALAVRGVTGVTDGWYALAGDRPALRHPGAALDQVQAAYTYPASDVDVAGMNVGWVLTGGLVPAVRAGGAAGYHRLLLAAGAAAQHIATAAAAAGLFCRPARSIHEGPLEAAAAAPAGHDALYLLLIGRSRVRDFSYDLLAPEVLS